MNNLLQKQLRAYYRNIRKHLSGKVAHKKNFITSLKVNITNFIEENSITDISKIQEHFGTPEEIAEAYLEEQPSLALTKDIRKMRTLHVITIAIILAMVLFFVYFLHELREGYGVEAEITIQEEPYTTQ